MAQDTYVSIVDLSELFSAPITAVINADFMAARQFARYIEEFGFTKAPSPVGAGSVDPRSLGDLRMVSFTLDQPGPNGRPEPRTVQLPALSLIPLPLLHVESAEFKFAVRVLEGVKRVEPKPIRLLTSATDEAATPEQPIAWQAMLVSEPPSRAHEPGASGASKAAPSLDANIKAQIHVRQADIPGGILRLLALMNENTQMGAARLTVDPPRVELGRGGRHPVTLTLTNARQEPLAGVSVVSEVPSGADVKLLVEGHAWLAKESIATDALGRIAVIVARGDAAVPRRGASWTVAFRASTGSGTLVESLTVVETLG